jgi:hypothetical protein
VSSSSIAASPDGDSTCSAVPSAANRSRVRSDSWRPARYRRSVRISSTVVPGGIGTVPPMFMLMPVRTMVFQMPSWAQVIAAVPEPSP